MEQKLLEKTLNDIGLRSLVHRNNNLMHTCPFHQERNPSWGISLVAPHFHGCFACHESGVLFDLLVRVGGYSVRKAKRICNLGEFSEKRDFAVLGQEESDELPEIDETELFPFILETKACKYLESRGIDPDTAKDVGCVYSPENDRILFPWNFENRLVGITGRSLNPNEEAKVLPFYGTKKSLALFLPNKKITAGPFIVVEGEIDALKVFDIGFKNVGSVGYGNLSKSVTNLILNSPAEEVIAFGDDDGTGKKLNQQIIKAFRSKLPVGRVSYKFFRDMKKYSNSGKLDPAELTRKDLRTALSSKVVRHADWPTF